MIEDITETFHKNISYIEIYHPKLFKKLSALDSAVENGYYQERYQLIYENGMFDVYEKSSDSYLYNKKSKNYSSSVAQSIDFKIEDNLFEGFTKYTISDENLKKYKEMPPFTHHMSGFAPIIDNIQQNIDSVATLKNIDKFIFFGVGLGLHISSVHQKIASKIYLIVEDDLELFRLSLFTINYQKIATDATVVFSVFEDNDEFKESAELFLKTEYYYNHYLKYFHMLSHSENKREQFHLAITSQSHLLFYYNLLLTQSTIPLEYIFHSYKFLEEGIGFSDINLDKKPFLLLAAGPSLEKNREWLKENHKNFTIVAISAILHSLEKYNIIPDIVTNIDPFENATIHFKRLQSREFLKDTLLFFSARTSKDIVNMFKKENIFFFESGTNYKNSSLKISAPCIGSATYQLLLKLDVKNLYLLGLDLAIDSQTGQTHSTGHPFIQTLKTDIDSSNNTVMRYKDSLLELEGNFQTKIASTPHFKTSIDIINSSTHLFKDKEQIVYNLSDGAKFNNTEVLYPRKLEFLKNSIEKNYLLQLCNENISIKLDADDVKNIETRLIHTENLYQDILKLENLEDIKLFSLAIADSSKMKKYELNRIIDTYLRYILSYIVDFCNRDRVEKDRYKELHNLLIEHLTEIIFYYKKEVIRCKILKK
ncbi:MAG: 6-hydroxymethylpterin diphosphokinase MptE-like protein [Campylobacterota bacterium]|nr:6-hydroxymethylpterin diphosphokinase MptE-like protein [Campylobacterota bacterium]